ncbi:hypothetical protein GCM10009760_45290 [Kitasatospora kazusensis]|uniref:Uncharacterized protein n=1 Tax=Kitasatospora kazusensis TaxID=407974 RepID=A0ABP5LU43_9ACTN
MFHTLNSIPCRRAAVPGPPAAEPVRPGANCVVTPCPEPPPHGAGGRTEAVPGAEDGLLRARRVPLWNVLDRNSGISMLLNCSG